MFLPNPKYELLFSRLALIFLIIGVLIALVCLLLHYVAKVAGIAFSLALICWIQSVIFMASNNLEPGKRLSYVKRISICYWGGMLICGGVPMLGLNLNDHVLVPILVIVGGIPALYSITSVWSNIIFMSRKK